jgi:murein DD-endopeptidase MepM/ murein hydrolase activator NlpD
VKKGKLLLLLILLGALGAGAFVYFRDTTAPGIEASPESGPVSARRPLTVRLTDAGAGLKSLRITVVQGEKALELVSRDFAAGTATAEETVHLGGATLLEGSLEVRITTVDHSPFRFGAGNTSEKVLKFDYDNKPPAVTILSTAHNINQGGAGLVVYTISEPVEKTGVTVGGLFFPGHRQASGTYLCLIAFPYDMNPATFVPKVLATDPAGNERLAGIYYHLNPKPFPTDRIEVSQKFLETKIVPDFQHYYPAVTDPLELFLKVNREMRKQNTSALLDFGQQTAGQPLWDGVFMRQPNAAVPGFFAQARTYYHAGQAIDRQTHLGIDLASTAQAPVPAANAGTVVFADELGIYGNCVVIDHGLGLQTLYGHLSQITVQKGETVSKGQIVGRTGATGMAGGDHLHLSVLIAGQQVNPLEWWDPNWLKNNISDKLTLAGTAAR